MIEALASAGVFVAVPLTGWWVLGRLGMPIPALARPPLWVSAGLAIWSIPLLLSLILAVFRPEVIGVAGWLVAAAVLIRRGRTLPRIPPLPGVDRIVVAGLLGAALLTAAYPADPFITGWDMGTYANHAVYMVNHGRLDVPYPWPAGEEIPPGFWPPGNLFVTEPTMTVRFANLWPAWLAQTWAASGYEGLVRLNAVLGFLALVAVYGLARRLIDARIAAVAILFLAFNPAQVWVARQTLSEIPTQLLIWSGLLLLTAYLARGTPRWGMWAGIILGLATFVRIDTFLLLPLILAANALWNVTRPDRAGRPAPPWRSFYLGVVPVSALALAYYALFSQPYLVELARPMLMIAMLGAVGAIALIVSRWPRVVRLARIALDQRAVMAGFLGLLTVLTAYAYFVRPALPPFAQYSAPGLSIDGLRTHIEDALPNLGRYLSPVVVWGALLGWSATFAAAMEGHRSRVLVPLLVVALGSTVVYVWDQSVTPHHFWAVRRFVPVIIPALVTFAGVAATLVLARLSLPGRRLALAATVPLLVIFSLLIGAPTYTVAERQGSYSAMSEFANTLPTGGQILAVDGLYEAQHYWMPLYLAFDRPIVQLDQATEPGRLEAIARLAGASVDDPVPLITAAHDFRMDAVEGKRTAVASWSMPVVAETVYPVPRETVTTSVTLTVIEATGLNTIGVPFGGPPQWVAATSGFHAVQWVDGRPLRWTDGHGRLSIPVYGPSDPARLAVSIADAGPGGTDVRIVLNGRTLFDGRVGTGPWAGEYELEGVIDLGQGDTARIEIISSVFERGAVEEDDTPPKFGVQLEHVILRGDEP